METRLRAGAFSWARANPFGALKLLRTHPELTGLAWVYFLLFFAHHVFASVFVLYAGYRYGWSTWEVGMALALWGVLDVGIQAVLVGPVVKRIGDRRTMVIGLYAGAIGLAGMAIAPDGWSFVAAIVLSSIWGLSQPTILALQTRRVSEREQGQLQGANMSVAAFAGIIAPLVFGAVYAGTVGARALLDAPGTSFALAALVMLAGAVIGDRVARRATAAEADGR